MIAEELAQAAGVGGAAGVRADGGLATLPRAHCGYARPSTHTARGGRIRAMSEPVRAIAYSDYL
jgi:hypothetical protein